MALPRIVVRGEEIHCSEQASRSTPSNTATVCSVPRGDGVTTAAAGGILARLPWLMWRANGTPLLDPLRWLHVTSRERDVISEKEEAMCEFSLEPIAAGLRRSASDTKSSFSKRHRQLDSPGDVSTAVCMAYDTRLRLEGNLSGSAGRLRVMADEDVTFTPRDRPVPRRNRFANGAQVTLQRLGPGVKDYVIDALLSPLLAPEMAEVL